MFRSLHTREPIQAGDLALIAAVIRACNHLRQESIEGGFVSSTQELTSISSDTINMYYFAQLCSHLILSDFTQQKMWGLCDTSDLSPFLCRRELLVEEPIHILAHQMLPSNSKIFSKSMNEAWRAFLPCCLHPESLKGKQFFSAHAKCVRLLKAKD